MTAQQTLRYVREYSANGIAPTPRFSHRSGPCKDVAFVSELGETGQKIATEGTAFVRFTVEHVPAKDDAPSVFRVTLSMSVRDNMEPTVIAGGPTVSSGEPHVTDAEASAAIALAGDMWTLWYMTGGDIEKHMLLQLLGPSEAFDATVAFSHLNVADRFSSVVVQRALDRIKDDPLASRRESTERLVEAFNDALPGIRSCLMPDRQLQPTAKENGVPLWDARLASWLDAQGCKKLAKGVRQDGAKVNPLNPWAPWLPTGDAPPLRRLTNVATALWENKVRPAIERESRSKPLHVRVNVSADGEAHARFPKIASPMSWAFGAPGKEVDMMGREVDDAPLDGATEVDGQRFASVPLVGQKALVPRSWQLLPHDRDKYPHQTSLPMATEEQEALPVVVSQNQGVVMSTVAGKLALLIFASPEVQDGEMSYVTLGELTRLVYPNGRVQQREVAATMSAVNEIGKLFLYLPDGRKLRIFDVTQSWAPDRAGASMPIHYGLTRTFLGAFEEVRNRTFSRSVLQGQEYTGDFLMNLSGMLALPNNQPALLRYYTRACALWNAACVTGQFDPSKVALATHEDWAIKANTLSHGVVEYMEAKAAGNLRALKPWHKSEASKSRKDVANDLDDLEGRGLVVLSKSSKAGTIRVLPPENWLEARTLGQTSGARRHRLAADIEGTGEESE